MGSIPACAGEPRGPGLPGQDQRVYPRVCGGTHYIAGDVGDGEGLSPRVRGNRGKNKEYDWDERSIPACAGEPGAGAAGVAHAEVYPRVCGGTRCYCQPV